MEFLLCYLFIYLVYIYFVSLSFLKEIGLFTLSNVDIPQKENLVFLSFLRIFPVCFLC